MDQQKPKSGEIRVPGPENGSVLREGGQETGIEMQREKVAEGEGAQDRGSVEGVVAPEVSLGPTTEPAYKAAKDPAVMRVERVLESNLWPLYAGLCHQDAGSCAAFRDEGESLAVAFRAEIAAGTVKPDSVWKRIAAWLNRIRGAKWYYLHQAAKIKTDGVVKLAQEERGAGSAASGLTV